MVKTSPSFFFSVITATYNADATLPRLLDSLACQTYRNFELIIQDGASIDNTVSIVESLRAHLPALSIASKPDKGIYDAWNKALTRIRGEWVLFLGADDRLASKDTLERCKTVLENLPETALYACGGIVYAASTGEIVATQKAPEVQRIPTLMRELMPLPHPGLFHRYRLFRNNRFDTTFSIAADYDFVCRTWKKEDGNAVIPLTITIMQRGGVSDTPWNALCVRWENTKIASKYFSGVWTFRRAISLAKSCIYYVICKTCGKRNALRYLDGFSRLRGVPPVWRGL